MIKSLPYGKDKIWPASAEEFAKSEEKHPPFSSQSLAPKVPAIEEGTKCEWKHYDVAQDCQDRRLHYINFDHINEHEVAISETQKTIITNNFTRTQEINVTSAAQNLMRVSSLRPIPACSAHRSIE